MTIRNGIDCSVSINKAVAAELVKQGNTFAARYLVPESYSKHLRPDEAKYISDAGMDILSVFETTAGRPKGGAAAGRGDAQVALNCARNIGQPKGTAIYFTADFDLMKQAEFDAAENYLRAATAVLGDEYAVGIYGEYDVIEQMAKRKACKHFWQTYAWSGKDSTGHNRRSQYANVYQFRNGATMAGIQVDLNNSFGGEGFWNLRPKEKVSAPTAPSVPDIPGTTRINVIAAMTKIGDGIKIGGTSYIPIRAVADVLGLSVAWDEKTKTVTITD